MILTPRDLDIGNTLLEVKILTIDQITLLFFPSTYACRNRLLVLRKNGWLEEERPRPYAQPHFSVLKLGKNAIRYFGYPHTKKEITTYLEHRLELNDLYVQLKSSGTLEELGLQWQDGSNFELPYQDTCFKPDARLIKTSDDIIYLEYDRGTKNLPIVQQNLSRYLSWFDEHERQDEKDLNTRLIYVTPKESRATAIQKQFEMVCSNQDRILPDKFQFHSLTTQAFLEQSKLILNLNKSQLKLVNKELGQTNQNTF